MAWCLTTRTIQGVMGRENAAAVARETERVTGGRLPDLDHLAERIMIPIGTGIDGEAGVGRGTRGEEDGIERAEEDVRKDVTGGGTFAVLAWGCQGAAHQTSTKSSACRRLCHRFAPLSIRTTVYSAQCQWVACVDCIGGGPQSRCILQVCNPFATL